MDIPTVTVSARRDPGAELQPAVDLGRLDLEFQPIVALSSGRIEGLEALVRSDRALDGVPSGEIAEGTTTTRWVGRWAVRRACENVAAWQGAGVVPPDMFVCVNVSAVEVREAGFIGAVEEALAWSGIAPSRLHIEISETALGRITSATFDALAALRAIGVRIVIDDFGTGQLALSHLRAFGVDGFKMAGDLVHVDDAGSRTARLAAAIVALGESLDMATVAEGIETSAQAERMRALGCTFGQGSFFARPLTTIEIDQGFEGLATDHRWRPEGLALHALPRPAPRAISVSHPDAA